MQLINRFIISLIFVCCFAACKKYLDLKPDKQLAVPSSLVDLQALLDNSNMYQFATGGGEASTDNYYLTTSGWMGMSGENDRNIYIWEKEIVFDAFPNIWSAPYVAVNRANIVLAAIDEISFPVSDSSSWKSIKGAAFFHRARCFLSVLLAWSKAYDESTAASDLGIPLRLNTDMNELSVRSSVLQSYQQVIEDLKQAIRLLPVATMHPLRPNRIAAYGLLARTYLAMRNYPLAGLYADSCLQIPHTLLDYNSLNAAANFPVPQFNSEVLFHAAGTLTPLNPSRAKIDSMLYRSYATDDLRKTVFFKNNNDGTFAFKGSYDASTGIFAGIALDEMYLIRAECLARAGNKDAALSDLNTLIKKRWKNTVTYPVITAADAVEALNKILIERRKELLMRDLRWMDIKRLNKEAANITLRRIVNGVNYDLPPNDPRFALPIPAYVIEMTGMQQNPR